ncbi:hypothetical protein DFJ58DRAFT_736195 [Suillus subalutaceus]|uniref:uncharacterized protein n=1 Tax=Suillus subalutaceus TaxID=48586 RepID=UPI001B880B6D|nr:uncharacterized protein DFJ58DRAFT_736195 [Suillus subalutaceus]KAG1833204.1 hypothetical protein DFJ58DRAFT_736195 [Suillus subalutaceus]
MFRGVGAAARSEAFTDPRRKQTIINLLDVLGKLSNEASSDNDANIPSNFEDDRDVPTVDETTLLAVNSVFLVLGFVSSGVQRFQFRYPAVQRYIHDLTSEIGEPIDNIAVNLSTFIEIGVPTIGFAQQHAAANLLNLSTVAMFFSAVTATTLQFSYHIAAAVNDLLGLTWKQANPNHSTRFDQVDDADNIAFTPPTLEVPYFALDTLKRSFICANSTIPISQLRRLYRALPDSEVLEEMITVAVTSYFPPCHDGRPPRAKTLDFSLSPRYLPTPGKSQTGILPADFVSRLFQKAIWTESTSRIVSGLIYTQYNVAKEFVVWFNSGAWTTIPLEPLLPAVHAVLSSLDGDAIDLFHGSVMTALFDLMLPQRRRPEGLNVPAREDMQPAADRFTLERVRIASRLYSFSLLTDLVTKLSVDCNGPNEQGFKAKAYFVEPLLTATIQNRLADAAALDDGCSAHSSSSAEYTSQFDAVRGSHSTLAGPIHVSIGVEICGAFGYARKAARAVYLQPPEEPNQTLIRWSSLTIAFARIIDSISRYSWGILSF